MRKIPVAHLLTKRYPGFAGILKAYITSKYPKVYGNLKCFHLLHLQAN